MLKTGGSQGVTGSHGESPSHVELQSVHTEERQRQRGSYITLTVANNRKISSDIKDLAGCTWNF